MSKSRAKIGYRSSLDQYPTAPKSCAHKLLEQVDAAWFFAGYQSGGWILINT